MAQPLNGRPSRRCESALARAGGALARLHASDRGAIFSEYIILTGLVAIFSIPAFLLAGAAVAHSFVFVRGYMLYPFP
jgi:hypothetical protein